MSCLLILIPLATIIILNLPLYRLMNKAVFWAGCALCLAQVYSVVFLPKDFWNAPLGYLALFFKFNLAVDSLTVLMLLTIGIIVFISILLARHFFTEEDKRFNFINLLIVILAAMNGVVLVKDIFSMYVFIEVTAVSSFILIAYNKRRDAFEAVFKYIILSAFATILMLTSIALILLISGDASFAAIKIALATSPHSKLVLFAVSLFLAGVFIKGGVVPFHGWVADAYRAAPRIVSVLLAGIVTKTVGVYSLIRVAGSVFDINGPVGGVIMFLGAASIIVGALEAMEQNHFKNMLAYSSISQVGYILLSFGCGTPLGIAGAVFHLFNHAIFKSLLFVNSAVLEEKTGTQFMNRLGGLAQKLPITGATSILGSLSTAGIPPLAGFWSKLIIILALWSSGHYVYAVIAVLASILTLAYMLIMQRRIFFGTLKEGFENLTEAGFWILLPTLILAAIVVGGGLFFPYFLNNFILPVGNILK